MKFKTALKYFNLLSTVLLAVQQQPCRALLNDIEITGLPVVNTSTAADNGIINLPMSAGPTFSYRVLINSYLQLNCTSSFSTPRQGIEDKTEAERNNKSSSESAFFTPHLFEGKYIRRTEVDAAFAGGQAVAAYQERPFRWIEFGAGQKRPGERVVYSGLFHNNDDRFPQYICRSTTDPAGVGLHSNQGCQTVTPPPGGNYGHAGWASKLAASHISSFDYHYSYQIMVTSRAANFSWVQVNRGDNTAKQALLQNALQVEIGDNEQSGLEPFRQLIVRVKVNATTNSSVVMGLSVEDLFLLLSRHEHFMPVELLVAGGQPLKYQVKLRLNVGGGRLNPVNRRAKLWEQLLSCSPSLPISSSAAQPDEIQLLNLEVKAEGRRRTEAAARAVAARERNFEVPSAAEDATELNQSKVTWKIFRREGTVKPANSTAGLYWGPGQDGSLLADQPLYANFSYHYSNRGNFANFGGIRALCRVQLGNASTGDRWVAGFLNLRQDQCVAGFSNVTHHRRYQLLYRSSSLLEGPKPEAADGRRLIWAAYNATAAEKLGGIVAGWQATEGKYLWRMFFARLPSYRSPCPKCSAIEEAARASYAKYGAVVVGKNSLHYVEGDPAKENALELEGADRLGLQILALV